MKQVMTAVTVTICAVILAGCGKSGSEHAHVDDAKTSCPACAQPKLYKPVIGFQLPDKYSSPDGYCLGPNNELYLSINNVGNGFKDQCVVLCITPDDKLEEVVQLPALPATGNSSPLGIGLATDGNLYVSDNQMFLTNGLGLSRVLRVVMKDGKAEKVETVAEGLNMANGLACKGDSIYVCDTTLGSETPMPSGVYQFKISELNAETPIKVTGLNDPHLIVKLETRNKEHPVGANGLCFDSKGNMYICNFGDAEVYKVTFDAEGNASKPSLLARGQGMVSTDGMHVDQNDDLWVADFLGNAVFKINSLSGKVTCIAKNAPGDGTDGALDAPSECIVRGKKVYVSNIDLDYGPNKADSLHTISVIQL